MDIQKKCRQWRSVHGHGAPVRSAEIRYLETVLEKMNSEKYLTLP